MKLEHLQLLNIDGQMVGFDDYPDAKGFVVIFTCNHCPYAIAYEARIKALDQQYAAKGYPVIAINVNDATKYPADSYENMQRKARDKQFSFPYLYDESQGSARLFQAERTPHAFILQRENDKLTIRYQGAIDDNWEHPKQVQQTYVEDALNALLAGESVALTSTKAVGCSIKWKSRVNI